MHKLKEIFLATALLLLAVALSGCGTNDIKSHKVTTVSYKLIKTNVDNEDVFALIPIPISSGKTTTMTFVPMYQSIDHLTVWYKDNGKTKVIKSDDFEFVKTSGEEHVDIKKEDIGKKNVDCVVYKHG